jgi:hypothetical protein
MSKLIQRYEALKEITRNTLQTQANLKPLASEVLTNVVLPTISAYQQKINVGVQDSLGDLLDVFKQKVSEHVFNTAAGWQIYNHDNFLLPRGCRFCFSKGKSVIVVIEQDPQLRSLLMNDCMVDREKQPQYDDLVDGVPVRITLAIPYTVFIFRFTRSELHEHLLFQSVDCGWRTTPLRSIDDVLSHPLLPNIHDGMRVCFGSAGNTPETNEPTVSTKCEDIIGLFWNSRFNHDLANYWWNKGSYDSRLRTGNTWNEASLEDSTFILHVNLPCNPEKTVGYFVEALTQTEDEPDRNGLRHRLSESIDQCVEALFSKVMRYFKKTKFDKYHPQDILNELTKAVEKANAELQELTFVIHHELESMKTEMMSAKATKKLEVQSVRWEKYCP